MKKILAWHFLNEDRMLRDGSLQSLFKRHQDPLIERARLCERRVFRIENPFLSPETPLNIAEYWFDPWRDTPSRLAAMAGQRPFDRFPIREGELMRRPGAPIRPSSGRTRN